MEEKLWTAEPSQSDRARFDKRCEPSADGCLIWTGAKSEKGYGYFWWRGATSAHRVAFMWRHGFEPSDLHHTCGVPSCVNPEHLVESGTGQFPRHKNADPNLCAQGHEFTEENTFINVRGERQCRQCSRDASRRYVEANRERVNARKRARRQHITYPEQPCQHCDRIFRPIRSTGRYCLDRDCINSRQRENRNKRLGR